MIKSTSLSSLQLFLLIKILLHIKYSFKHIKYLSGKLRFFLWNQKWEYEDEEADDYAWEYETEEEEEGGEKSVEKTSVGKVEGQQVKTCSSPEDEEEEG